MSGDDLCRQMFGAEAYDSWSASIQQQPTITSIDQLDALPKFAVLRYGYTSRAGLKHHEIWERLEDGWFCIGAPTSPPDGSYGTPSLPATLIWHPDRETT